MKILVLAILFANSLLAQAPEVLNKVEVVRSVNGVQITKADLDRGVKALFPARYYHGTISDEKMASFEKEVIEELIDKELLFQYAKSLGLKVDESKIDESIEMLKSKVNNKERLNQSLKKMGMTFETLKETIYKEEMLKKLEKQEIETNLSEDDLREYYENNLYKFQEPEKIELQVIYTRNDPTDPEGRSKAKERIESAKEKLDAGEDFGDVAAKYSTAMSRINGGDLGYIHKGMLEPSVEEQAFSMPENSVSDIIEESIGFFIIKVKSKTQSKQLAFEKIEEGLAKDLKKRLEKEKKSNLLKRLKSTALITQ